MWLEIVTNPWAETDINETINDIINKSDLNKNIKKNISITRSELLGLIK